MPRNLFRAQRRNINETRRALSADTVGDFKATSSMLDSIMGNLQTAASGIGANLTSAQAREMAAVQRLAARSTAKARGINTRALNRSVNRYGSAMGPAAETALGPARAAAKATGTIAKGSVKAAKTLTEAGQLAQESQERAVQEAQASADYALAVALKSRFQDDAATVAQMRFDLQSQRLNARLALQAAREQAALDWKYRQKELEMMQDKAKDDPAIQAGLTIAASSAADSFTSMQKMAWAKNENGDYRYRSAAELADAYIAQNGVSSPEEATMIQAIARSMWSAGAGPLTEGQISVDPEQRQQMVIDSIMETFLALYPDYQDMAENIRNYLEASGNAAYSAWTTGIIDAAGGGVDSTSPDTRIMSAPESAVYQEVKTGSRAVNFLMGGGFG